MSATADRPSPPLTDYLLLALLATLWGASYTFMKLYAIRQYRACAGSA
jgi:hypothetical protein